MNRLNKLLASAALGLTAIAGVYAAAATTAEAPAAAAPSASSPAATAATAAPAATAAAAANDGQSLARRGAYLARAGDCMACHSAAGKPAYSGGLAIDSGHGMIYSTNITPDAEHGIGKYSERQFADAVRKGMRADGTHLYPAMPYPSYAKVSDADIHALYTYFMSSVKPVAVKAPDSTMSFPFNQRWGMALWNFFFASDQPFKAQAGWSGQVRQGAYLVEGLGHCGSCHTPRGVAMNEKALDSGNAKFLSGGELDGWPVPSLRGMGRWSEQDIVDYLQTGRNKSSSVAGEMTAVVEHSMSHMTDEDVHGIAQYLKQLTPAPASKPAVPAQGSAETVKKLSAAVNLSLGERLYMDNCAACHFVTGKGANRIFPELDGATVVNADNPTALLHIILAGARTPSTAKAPSILVMPGFGQRLSDSEAATLATFVRQGWSNTAPAVSESDVAKVRAKLH